MNKAIMLLCALALARAAYPITATKAYVDGATNATLAAAKAYTDTVAGVTPTVVTNIAGRVTSNVVTKAYVEALGISGGGITTNDVNAIIASSNLCDAAHVRSLTINAVSSLTNNDIVVSNTNIVQVLGTYYPTTVKIGRTSGVVAEGRNTLSIEDGNQYGAELDIGKGSVGLAYIGGDTFGLLKVGGNNHGQLIVKNRDVLEEIDEKTSETDVISIVGRTSVTNGGAKAYADATFLKHNERNDVPGSSFSIYDVHTSGRYSITNKIIYFESSKWRFGGFCENSEKIAGYVRNYGEEYYGSYWIYPRVDTLNGTHFSFSATTYPEHSESYNYESKLYPDNSPVATSNMVERVVASKPSPSPLTGKTYDFANGVNFTKNLYTALTNVIQTLGGTVANPPAFN